jgi:hypothetical protein
MTVKNLNGTSDSKKCSCGSWLKHWENYAGRETPFCAEKICSEVATDGAHVQKESENDSHWYIIPLCHKHNTQAKKELEITDYTKLVRATDRDKCEAPRN